MKPFQKPILPDQPSPSRPWPESATRGSAMAIERLSEAAMLEALREVGSPFGPEVEVDITAFQSSRSRWDMRPDLAISVQWAGESFEFAADVVSRSTPRFVENVLGQTMWNATQLGRLPMIIVPFLSERIVALLERAGVSGLDLCGNGFVVVPGRLLLKRTGKRNLYPQSQPARFVYRGATSQVPRVFLRRSEYASVGGIRKEIDAAGGKVALSTVSKALARMVDDLIIERDRNRVRLIQSEKLLDLLAKSHVPPRTERVIRAKLNEPLNYIFKRTNSQENAPRVVLSGESSQSRYTAGMRADDPVLYCSDLTALAEQLGDSWQITDRFADIAVIETREASPWLDARTDESGVVYASPVQTYLELTTSGDKRDREIAEQVCEQILREIGTDPGGETQ